MTITIVSADAAGNEGNGDSYPFPTWAHNVSADGRYVAFYSLASNLVAGDTNGAIDIFVKDTQTGAISRLSVDGAGAQANAYSYSPSISADGRYVAFRSAASNLVADDTNVTFDVFLKDTQTGAMQRVSTDATGVQANSASYEPSISTDGRYVAFYSFASNLVSGDTNGTADIFIKDTQTGAITRVSVDGLGAQANSSSQDPSISADGRYVAFYSNASNLVAGDTNGTSDIFVKDTQTGAITRVSVDGLGAQANSGSVASSISADGRYVAFNSNASNLVSGDTNGTNDIFVKDTLTGAVQRVSTNGSGAQANSGSSEPSISADGRYVTFNSSASNLVSGDTNGASDIFVKDTQTGAIARLSVDGAGAQANSQSYYASISADGRTVAFFSYASNLVPGDTNNRGDVFLASNPLAPPAIFTAAADVVDLNSFDLSLYTLAEATNALDGDDTVTLSETQNIGLPFDAGDGNDNVTGSNNGDNILGADGNDTIIGGDGNDTIVGGSGSDLLEGGAGSDTYRYNLGETEGDEIREDFSGDLDTIEFDASITPFDVRLVRGIFDTSLQIFVGSDVAPLSVSNQFSFEGYPGATTVEQITFTDGTVIDLYDGLTLTGTDFTSDGIGGTYQSDTLIGLGGDDTLYAYDGDDTLIGGAGSDYLDGGFGGDTYRFSLGETAGDQIADSFPYGFDTIEFDASINPFDVRLFRGFDLRLEIWVGADAAPIVVDHQFNYDGSPGASPIEQVTFADGTVIDLTAGLELTGTTAQDYMGGTYQGDFILGLDGDDYAFGEAGNDFITGGTGADTLDGGSGDDTFIVVAGDIAAGDIIDGGTDTDTLQVDGGGTIDLTLLSLSNIEQITLTDFNGTDVTVTEDQAYLISAAQGLLDIVTIDNTATNPALALQLLNAGVEQVNWANSSSGSVQAFVDPSDPTQFVVRSTDTDLTRPFDYIRTTYDASGNRVAQTQLFDTGLSNGMLQQQVYDPLTGGLISNIYLDTLGTRTFQSITTDYTNGIRTHSRTINDNNTMSNADDVIVDQYYDAAGVITLELQTDASPGGTGKPWVSVAREYVGGVTQLFRTTYDNLNQQVVGQAGTQEIEGGAGNDVLLGGAGADVFVFAGSFGNDTVHDYLDGTDKLDFTAFNVDTRAELDAIASITAAGTATLIDFGGGDRVTIRNLSPAAINDSDFILV